MRLAAVATVVAVSAVAVTGCAGPPGVAAPPYDGLWRVAEYGANGMTTVVAPRGGELAFGGRDAQLFVDGDRISLQAPCNQVGFETAAIEGDRLLVTGLGRTEMGCSPEGVMSLEDHLLDVIGDGPQVAVDGDELTLTAQDGRWLGMIRVEPDPDRPLVTSSAVAEPPEQTDLAGSSEPPTPPPTTGSEVPTPGWEPPVATPFPLDTFVPPVPGFMPEAAASGTLSLGEDGCLRLGPDGPIVLWRDGLSAVQDALGNVTVVGIATTGDRLLLTGGLEEPTPARCDQATAAFSAYRVEIEQD